MTANPLRRLAFAASFALLAATPLALSAVPAQAQFFGEVFGSRFAWGSRYYEDDRRVEPDYEYRGMPPRAVHRMLANQGYRLIGPVVRRGRVYLANVSDGETGQRERLVIDAFSGDVLESYPLAQRIAPPANVTRVPRAQYPRAEHPRADVPEPRRAPRTARLAPPAEADPLVVPGHGAAPKIIKPRPVPRARAPAKPKPELAKRTPPDAPKTYAPTAPAIIPPLPAPAAPLPGTTQPSNPLSLPPLPAETAAPAPAAPEPTVAAVPPAAPPPVAAPPTAPEPVAAPAPRDVFVAPLDDATPAPKARKPVNDIPVAPLE